MDMCDFLPLAILVTGLAGVVLADTGFESDVLPTSSGDLTMTFIGHGTLMFRYDGKVVHVDPWGDLADYAGMPRADIILITHEHGDHLDPAAVETLRKTDTTILLPAACADKVKGATVMTNGQSVTAHGIAVEATPAYNIAHMRGPGRPFHPRGVGNGYVLTFGDRRVYVAGDTENIPEMKALKEIDVAFLPMNLPYTMTPEMAADAARAFRPSILYPYHYGNTDAGNLTEWLKGTGIDVRIRKLR